MLTCPISRETRWSTTLRFLLYPDLSCDPIACAVTARRSGRCTALGWSLLCRALPCHPRRSPCSNFSLRLVVTEVCPSPSISVFPAAIIILEPETRRTSSSQSHTHSLKTTLNPRYPIMILRDIRNIYKYMYIVHVYIHILYMYVCIYKYIYIHVCVSVCVSVCARARSSSSRGVSRRSSSD